MMIGRVYKDEKTAVCMGFDKYSSRPIRRHIARAVRRRIRREDRKLIRQMMAEL